MSIENLLALARRKLADSPSARLDAEVLLAHVLESSRSFLYANPCLELPRNRSESFRKLVRQRAHGHPVAYLTGHCEFWSLNLAVNPSVLIPRPDTELLVECALELIPQGCNWRIADLGTGCGAIALALASERRGCDIQATDTCLAALRVAAGNAARLGLEGITRFHHGSWAEPLPGQFQLIVSNPPYIDAGDPHLGLGDLRFEPREALTPGADGLAALREISRQVPQRLCDGGWLLLEHGWNQSAAVRNILAEGGFTAIESRPDLQGHERVTMGCRP